MAIIINEQKPGTPTPTIADPGVTGWRPMCQPCIIQWKGWHAENENNPGNPLLPDEPPVIRRADTMMGGTAVCMECIRIQRTSPLQVPAPGQNGHPLLG